MTSKFQHDTSAPRPRISVRARTLILAVGTAALATSAFAPSAAAAPAPQPSPQPSPNGVPQANTPGTSTTPSAQNTIPGLPGITLPPGVTIPHFTLPTIPGLPVNLNLMGKTVYLDPGHQGAATPAQLKKQIPDGRGGTKDCQTMGAKSVDGVYEHTINWKVAQAVRTALQAQGIKVVMSRPNDTTFAGCVDQRAEAANASKADVALSIHADSTSDGADHQKKGFSLLVPKLPVLDKTVTEVQGTKGKQATEDMRSAMEASGFTPANYAGTVNGVQTRTDLAGPNLTKVPLVFLEMGNLSNPSEARDLESVAGQARYAMAITQGLVKFLGSEASAHNGTAPSATAPRQAIPKNSQTAPATAEAPDATSQAPGTSGSSEAPGANGTTNPNITQPGRVTHGNLPVIPGLPAIPGLNQALSPKSTAQPNFADSHRVVDDVTKQVSAMIQKGDTRGATQLLQAQQGNLAGSILAHTLASLYGLKLT